MRRNSKPLTPDERVQTRRLAELSLANPFLPRRARLEAEVLGVPEQAAAESWSLTFTPADKRSRATEDLLQLLTSLVARWRQQFTSMSRARDADAHSYVQMVRFYLFLKFQRNFHQAAGEDSGETVTRPARMEFWKPFLDESARCLGLPGLPPFDETKAAHLFAILFQIRRAFVHIYKHIVGRSPAAARLRAATWESIFTHDLDRYIASRHRHTGDIPTLITGPSGSGKELVARAIGLSRYVPFVPGAGTFVGNYAGSFHPVNLSALTPTLIESELFGHQRGAFTGALANHQGWLERCPPHGTVFLDEIGEFEVAAQVKLLRVLQTRLFQRVGDATTRRFSGKIVVATNRDLGAAIAVHRFRADLYYRLCGDILATPSLQEQLADSPDDLALWVEYIGRQMGEEEPSPLVAEVVSWVEHHLGNDYAWPGNFRELEQCVRNIWIRKTYRPVAGALAPSSEDAWLDAARTGRLTAEELLQGYCARAYSKTGNYRAVARALKLDWRTVRLNVEQAGNTPGLRPLNGQTSLAGS